MRIKTRLFGALQRFLKRSLRKEIALTEREISLLERSGWNNKRLIGARASLARLQELQKEVDGGQP